MLKLQRDDSGSAPSFLFECFSHLLAQFRRVGVTMHSDSMMHSCFQKLIVAVGKDCYRAIHLARVFATINKFPGHWLLLPDPNEHNEGKQLLLLIQQLLKRALHHAIPLDKNVSSNAPGAGDVLMQFVRDYPLPLSLAEAQSQRILSRPRGLRIQS
jgi:hypothetical protein